ncbi:MAG: ATP-binding protein, partial [Burkholderiales bacterium]
GTVVICARTHVLAGGHFEYRDLGRRELKGWPEPVSAWQVIRASQVESHFEARHESSLAPLIGRDEEVELLLRRWKQATDGEGRVVIVTGEPGIGKSHLVRALQQRLEGTEYVVQRLFCSEHQTNATLFPFIVQLERDLRFEPGDSPADKLAKLGVALEGVAPDANDAIHLLADLLLLPMAEPQNALELTPKMRKERTLAALVGRVETAAAQQSLLVICEDVHWIDPTSLELLCRLVERVGQLPSLRILLVITARTEFSAPWPAHEHVTTLAVRRLGRRDGAALVTRIAAGKALPHAVMNDILSRTDGVPLFIEELTKTVLEGGRLRELADRYEGSLPPHDIPTTLHTSLLARLDRLGPVKEIAQIGAVAGREFSYELLHAVSGWPAPKLNAALRELVHSELVFQRGETPHALFNFKHVLVRDAATATLLKKHRMRLHAAIANALEHRFLEIVAGQPETIAYHLAEADMAERAIPYWLEAGRNAARRSANIEAIAHLRCGLDAAARSPVSAKTERLQLDLLIALAPCLIATQGPASSDALECFSQARDLCQRLGDAPEYPRVMFWLVTASVMRGELEQALEGILAVRRDAETRADSPAIINATRGQAMILLFMGRVVESHEGMQQALDVFARADEAARLAARSAGQDAGAAGLAQMAWVLWLRGYVDTAVVRAGEAVARATAIAHPHTQAYASYYAAVLHALRNEPAIANLHASRCLALSQEHGFRQWLSLSRAIAGICPSTPEEPTDHALAEVSIALDEYRSAGYQLGITVLYVLLCRVLLANHASETALEVIEQGLSIAERTNERIFEAELCRLKAGATLDAAPAARVEARLWLERALTVARTQGARSLELRAARDIAALYVGDGKHEQAQQLLRPVLGWFTEGAGTNDLREANAMLDHA